MWRVKKQSEYFWWQLLVSSGLVVLFPVDKEQDEVVQPKSLHVVVVDNIDTEVEQVLGVFLILSDECAHSHSQFGENILGDITVRVDEITKEMIFLNSFEVIVTNVEMA